MDFQLNPTPIVGGAFPATPRADLALDAFGDLALDRGLQTAVTVSLLTDRRADPDDFGPDGKLPDGTDDRRGWWADDPDDPIGSKLWLLARSRATQDTLNRAVSYIGQALAWGIADGVWQKVDVSAFLGDGARYPRGFLGASVILRRVRYGGAASADRRFDLLWTLTVQPAPGLSFFAWDAPGAGFDTSGIVWA